MLLVQFARAAARMAASAPAEKSVTHTERAELSRPAIPARTPCAAHADARPLDQMTERSPGVLRVRVDLAAMDEGALDRLQQLFASRPGRCRVAFELVNPDGTVAMLEAQKGVQPDPDLVAAVREICGREAVAVVG